MPPIKTKSTYKHNSTITGNFVDLSLDEVRDQLRKQGIRPPPSFTKEQLLELLNENKERDADLPSLNMICAELKTLKQTVAEQWESIRSIAHPGSGNRFTQIPPMPQENNIVTNELLQASSMESGIGQVGHGISPMRISAGMIRHVQTAVRRQIMEGGPISRGSCMAAVGIGVVLAGAVVLPALGFTPSGIAAGSCAASWRATFCGAVPAGRLFATVAGATEFTLQALGGLP